MFLFIILGDVGPLILSHCTVQTLLSLTLVNHDLHSLVSEFSLKFWNLNRFLSPWFADPTEFRCLMQQNGAIISGSQALQFFNGENYAGSDLDVILPRRSMKRMAEWMEQRGYRAGRIQECTYDINTTNGIHEIRDFYRRQKIGGGDESDDSDGDVVMDDAEEAEPSSETPDSSSSASPALLPLKIQLISLDTYRDPIAYVLAYHSTAVINYITATSAVSVFARQTLIDKTSYVSLDPYVRSDTKKFQDWVQKYESRGFNLIMKGSEPSVQDDTAGGLYGVRSTNDWQSWMMEFPLDGAPGPHDKWAILVEDYVFEVFPSVEAPDDDEAAPNMAAITIRTEQSDW